MSTIPSDMVAVFDTAMNRWYLYLISSEGDVNFFKGPVDNGAEGSRKPADYELRSINWDLMADPPPRPKAGNSQLGVLEYIDSNGNNETRVYYLDRKDRLTELAWSGGSDGNWYRGSLTIQEFKATPGSVINTAVTKDQLKVYYREEDDDGKVRLFVAYSTINQTGWLRRLIKSFG